MIIGHIENLPQELYKFSESLQKALSFIQENDCAHLKPGRYEIDGDRIFALVQHYKTKQRQECRAETHEKYLDVQYIAKGREYMGYCAANPKLEVEEDCLAERDAKFYKSIFPESDILLTEGMYAVLFPSDVHRPSCMAGRPEDVVKFVIKVAIDTLK